ncbi:hypothetical protein C5167_021289 [Papaver somniferum]|uniref:RING-type E3 ubiquitin transferase n=1 Tax=Papaver somniferum TaxID=3469 RepID=A0A4Y7IYS5_PAPSO|nr:hypothetical protein C5167_021289 [Papaver somniferum]
MGPSVGGDDELGMPNVVVAIDKDKNSQFALKWAIENLPISNQSIILVHVKIKVMEVLMGAAIQTKIRLNHLNLSSFSFPFAVFVHVKGNFMKKQEVPSAVVKLAPDFCNVYVISKSKAVTIRSASRPVPVGAPARNQSSPKVVDALPPKHLSASDNSDSEDSNT